jgi:hypothetical protein
MTLEKATNLINMLSSPDQENHVLACSLIEELDFVKCIGTIGLAYKLGHKTSHDVWEKNAPNIMEKFKLPFPNVNKWPDKQFITFKDIFNVIMTHKAPVSEMEIFLKFFGDYMTAQCDVHGYTDILKINMSTTLNKQTDE